MFCKACLRRNFNAYYKLNSKYMDLMDTITEVKMNLNDLVCCFCLVTLRKIENFTKMVKEVDSILKQPIKTEEHENEVNEYYNLVVSTDRNISIDCSRALSETYACNIRDAVLRQVEKDLVKIEETEDEPLQLSEDTIIDNGTDSTSDMPLQSVTFIKEEQNESTDQNDEPQQLPKVTIVGNETDSEEDVPLITLAHIKGESEKSLNDTCDHETTETNGYLPSRGVSYRVKPRAYWFDGKGSNDLHKILHFEGAVLHELLNRTSSKGKNYKVVNELPREEVVQQNITRKRRNNININDVLSTKISKQNNVSIICPSDKPFSCDTCAFKAKHKSKLIIHLRKHTGEKPFACNICSYKSSLKYNLRVHLRTHAGEKPFVCHICSYKCSRKDDLSVHLRIHTGEKFACNNCSYKCSRKSHLRKHLRIHTGEKPFECVICTYKTADKSNLSVHLRTHTEENSFAHTHTGEKPFACNICSYKCSRKIHLRSHLRIHTGEKPFECVICTYKTADKSNLSKHLRIHTDEKPFACNICSYKSSQKCNLRVHLRKHTDEKCFSCNVCLYKCIKKSDLRLHLRTHTGEKPFACNICLYKCTKKSLLSKHLKSHR